MYAAGNINFTVINNGGCKRLKWVIVASVLIPINSSYTIHYCITMNQLVEALCVCVCCCSEPSAGHTVANGHSCCG